MKVRSGFVSNSSSSSFIILGYKIRDGQSIDHKLLKYNSLDTCFDDNDYMYIGKQLSDDFINDREANELDIEHLISYRREVQEKIEKAITDKETMKEIDNQVTPKIYVYACDHDC